MSFVSIMMVRNVFVLGLAILGYRLYLFSVNINEEFYYGTCDFIKKFGYNFEEHVVESLDGFITKLYRVLPPNNETKNIQNVSILLEGGVFCSSDILVFHRNNLAFFLVDAGYDVWLGNYRGNKYSRPGLNANYSDPYLYYYGYHEMGVFDFAVTIDYILNETKREKLNFIAVSVGSNSLLALLSTKPEYNGKINKALHLGSGFALKLNNWYQKLFFYSLSKGSWFVLKLGALEPWPLRPLVTAFFCDNTWLSDLCCDLMEKSTGLPDGRNSTMASLIMTVLPSGSPVGVVDHLLQLSDDDAEFSMRDYGSYGNWRFYNSQRPPLYDVTRVTVPTKVYYAQDDSLVRHEVARKVFSLLPNVIGETIVSQPFSHINFLTNNGRNREFVRDVLETFSND